MAIDNPPFLDQALTLYRQIKGSEPTQRCVLNGKSCSQRFESTLNEARANGANELEAGIQALQETGRVCSEINGGTPLHGVVKVLTGTGLVFLAGTAALSGCNDRDTREEYGCANNVCEVCPPNDN